MSNKFKLNKNILLSGKLFDLIFWSLICNFVGMEGGFDVGVANYEFEEHNSIVVLPEWKEIPLDDPEIPPEVREKTM